MTGARRAFRPDYIPTLPATSRQHPIQHNQPRCHHEQSDLPPEPAAGFGVFDLAPMIDSGVPAGISTK